MTSMTAKIVHIAIERPWKEVYAFAADPRNMPQWASGLASGLEQDGPDWIVQGVLGSVRVRFAEPNAYGVIDHTVTLPDGREVYNALRVTPNGSGCEVMFTVLKLPGMSDSQFDGDRDHVRRDLETLKAMLEA